MRAGMTRAIGLAVLVAGYVWGQSPTGSAPPMTIAEAFQSQQSGVKTAQAADHWTHAHDETSHIQQTASHMPVQRMPTGPIQGQPSPNGVSSIDLLNQPTYINPVGHHGVPNWATSTDPNTDTLGIRLDTRYMLVSETMVGQYMSEHQHVTAIGATILPIQAPGWMIGFRPLATRVENNSMIRDVEADISLDLYYGTRYKQMYLKVGAFYDHQDFYSRIGVQHSLLLPLPILGEMTTDVAIGFGQGADRFFADQLDTRLRLFQRRVEISNLDIEYRVGKFFTPSFQFGFSGNYYTMQFVDDEWGAGAFMNKYFNRFRLGAEFVGGRGGMHGYVVLGVDWGASSGRFPARPQDCNTITDTVRWMSRPPQRDLTIHLRDSFTGPPAR